MWLLGVKNGSVGETSGVILGNSGEKCRTKCKILVKVVEKIEIFDGLFEKNAKNLLIIRRLGIKIYLIY